MFNTLTSAVCSLFSYEAFSYSVPQLPQASLQASASIFSTVFLIILFMSGCGLITLQMRRFIVKGSCNTSTSSPSEEVRMTAIDGHNLCQKGKPPEDAKDFSSARAIAYKPKLHGLAARLSDHQKARRRAYSHIESNDLDCFSLKDIAIEHRFNQIIRRKSDGGFIKELPAVQPRSPLVFEQCSTIDLIKRAGTSAVGKPSKFKFSLPLFETLA